MKSEIITLEVKVKVSYESDKTRDWILRRLPNEIELNIEGGGLDGGYSMKLQSAKIQK